MGQRLQRRIHRRHLHQGLVDGHDQARLLALGDGPGPGIQPLALVNHRPGLVEQGLAGRRQLRQPPPPVEEGAAQVVLQVADGGADRRLGAPQPACRGGKRALFGGGDQAVQLVQGPAH